MTEQRRLAAIVAADVVGYSRLMGRDESGTLAALKALRRELIDPAIAVLPFANVSGDPEQEYFTDGISEDIITDLSKLSDLHVIARNSAFVYKRSAVAIPELAKALGVRYVLEGSVRRAGNRIRVTAQLIDATTGGHAWAERYDRDLEDIFAIQDEMTSAIVAVLPGRVEAATRDRAARKPTDSMAAYECLVTAKVLHHRSTLEDNTEALRLASRATQLDPKYAHAHAWRACILGQAWTYDWCENIEATEAEIERELALALALDDNDSDVHRILAAVWVIRNDFDKATYHQQRALRLNPNDDLIVVQQGEILTWLGQPDEGVEWILKAMRLNPFHPDRFWSHLARAHFVARRYAQAVDFMRHVAAPNLTQRALLAACLAHLGDTAAAAEQVREVLKQRPTFRIEEHVVPMLHYRRDGDLAHHREGLLMAGFTA